MRKLMNGYLVGGLALALSGCSDDDGSTNRVEDPGTMDPGTMDPGGEAPVDIVDTAVAADGFDSLVAAVQKAGLEDTLRGDGPFTVLAPTDAAFSDLLDELGVGFDDLTADDLTPILTYHVIAAEVPSSEVVNLDVASTVNGADLRIRVEDGDVIVTGGNGDVSVVATDIEASNGVIHVIDQVLLPPADIPTVATNAGFDSLVAAVGKAELASTLSSDGPFTVFAPTDEAFAALLDELGVTLDDLTREDLTPILGYHVVPGKVYSEDIVGLSSAMTVEGSEVSIAVDDGSVVLNGDVNVVATDVLADNGVIHVIDQVLLPPTE